MALPEEQENEKKGSEYVGDKGLSQGEAGTIHDINVNPSEPELFQAPATGSQDGYICPSSISP